MSSPWNFWLVCSFQKYSAILIGNNISKVPVTFLFTEDEGSYFYEMLVTTYKTVLS
jgi:hypothetical protein